jgi:hypothetical protein
MVDLSIADALAADLAGGQVDPNEAQKALAYLRHSKDPQQFFAYLRAINKDGRAVIRSGRTLTYYRELLLACERHLRNMSAEDMAQTLGWAIRLLRYYKAVPDEVSTPAQRQTAHSAAAKQAVPASTPKSAPVPETPVTPRIESRLPAVGERFRGEIDEIDDELGVVLLKLPASFDDATGATIPMSRDLRENTLVVIPPQHKTGGGYRPGNTRWVEVIGVRKQGRLLEVKPTTRPTS